LTNIVQMNTTMIIQRHLLPQLQIDRHLPQVFAFNKCILSCIHSILQPKASMALLSRNTVTVKSNWNSAIDSQMVLKKVYTTCVGW
jgi:hypothetical protein